MRLDEKLKIIYETIAPAITRTEEEWKDYLRFGSAVYKHQFDNALLVYAQNPKATMLATFDIWTSPKVTRSVNSGAKGIAVCEYANSKHTVKHLFDISQTNGAKIPDVWKLDDELRQGLIYRLAYNHDTPANNFTECISQIAADSIAENLDGYLQGFENDIKDHFLGEMPQNGLMAEVAEIIYNSCVYYIANRCGETADVVIPTIPHFNTIPLVARLGYTVTEISKGILLEIERNVKIIENERSAKNEQRIDEQQEPPGTTDRAERGGNDRGRQGPASRQVRQDGDELFARGGPAKVFTFENARRAYEPDVSGGRGSDGANRENNAEAAGKRPDAADQRYNGAGAPLEQTQGHSGGNSDKGTGPHTEITKTENEPQGSFSMPELQGPPYWKQYNVLTERYPDSIVFKRLGDFYEAMGENAKTAAVELDLILASREIGLPERAPIIGVPVHTIDKYINLLLQKNYSVITADGETITEHGNITENNLSYL